MPIKFTLTPSTGGESQEIHDIIGVNWGVTRSPAPNGYLGQDGHSIQRLNVTRQVALSHDGEIRQDLEITDLSAALGDKAYFEGELVYSKPENRDKPIRVYRFDGHICGTDEDMGDDYITQSIQISVTRLDIGNATFNHTTQA